MMWRGIVSSLVAVWFVGGLVGCISLVDYERVKTRAETAEKVWQDTKNRADQLEADYDKLKAELRSVSGLRQDLADKDTQVVNLKAQLRQALENRLGGTAIFDFPEGSGFDRSPKNPYAIMLPSNLTFASGKAEIMASYKPKLLQLAALIKKNDATLLVNIDGYTDRQKIDKSNFLDNWHLGAMRAHAVARFLWTEGGIPQKRFVVSSFGETNEIEPAKVNSPANRRVEVRLMPPSNWSGAAERPTQE